MGDENTISVKEERIRKMALSYYSRQDIRKAMFEFSKNRECVPRYFEGFGKRPDTFSFDSDILEHAKKGATSFHGSEEIWSDPLLIHTSMTDKETKENRIGWDLLIDIDCKYLEYSKKAAYAIVEALKKAGVKNIGVKYSGGKGFHIIVPSKAFPVDMSGKKTCDMFPEWPRQICYYLKEQSRPFLEAQMANEDLSESNFKVGVRCEKCKNIAETKEKLIFVCPLCKNKLEAHPETIAKKRIIRCPDVKCGKQMKEEFRESFYQCNTCNINSKRSPDNFKTMKQFGDIFAILGLDLVLVSSRHLFRMPYSLHEKTALASVVIDQDKILDFEVKDADPLRITPLPFMPDSQPNEAFNLLRESLEMVLPEEEQKRVPTDNFGEKKFNDVTITNLTPDMYPPTIQKILAGMPTDGRKRGLFILLNFFTSLKLSLEQISAAVEEWNKKNYEPLKSGYIKAQLSWYSKTKPKMPPNFDKPFYKEIGITPTAEEIKTKNPVSYTIKKAFSRGQATSNAKK